MGAERKSSKGKGIFFNLFDWSGKSRKKLFSNDFDLPERTKQGKRSEENLPSTRLHLIEGDEIGALSAMGSSDFSCTSSVTDEEGTGIKPPSVVAKLMGLDTLPGPYVAEPNSTPFFDARSVREACYQKKIPDLSGDYQNVSSKGQISGLDGFPRKEVRPQKMPSSPIERFQIETLPPKSAKSLPITQHKLLSPIKNPGFVSTKNANDIMEAAAKIIEPGLQASSKAKLPSVGSTSVPIKIRDLKENVRSQRTSNLPEVPRRPVESNAVKYLKGQSMTKSWNGPEDIPSFKTSSDMERSRSFDGKNKGKSVSLAIQAKANVQKREALNSGRSSLVMREESRQKSSEPFKSQQITVKNNENKSSMGQKSSSGVLRQNNQKQNFLTNKSKLPTKPLASNQQARKSVPEDTSYARGISNKVSGNYRNGNKQQVLGTSNLAKDVPSSRTKNIHRKKRAIGESGLNDTVSVDKDDKKIVHSDATVSECLDLREDDRRNGGDDVVSFTFTSPFKRAMPGTWSSRQTVEKRDKTKTITDSSNENNTREQKSAKASSLGLNVIGGDALSILLEQKLRELALGVESSCYNSAKENMGSSSSILQEVLPSINALSIMPEGQGSSKRPYKENPASNFSSDCSTTNVQEFNMNHKFQGMERRMVDYSSSINIQKQFKNQHLSPVSILEASISNGSINSSESLGCSNGSQTHSSTQSQVTIGSDSSTNTLFVDVDAELSDSASSAFTGAADHAVGHMRTDDKEVEYMKEILHSSDFEFKNLPLGRTHGIINPHLFNRLEIQKIGSGNEEENMESRVKRMELFDCVSECVDLKCSRYNCRGYKAWSKGVMVVRKEGLSAEIYREILGWRSMADQTADELVEKDMSCHLGTWLDFEVEAFEIGVEIGRRILSNLVAEAVADMLV